MTLRLILVRHAKSAWDDPALPDHARPLNGRGRRSARAIGDWLADRGFLPDEVLCSDAVRTRETWERLSGRLTDPPSCRYQSGLYHASAEAMLSVLHRAKGPSVMLIGHNPGIGALAGWLLRQPPDHPDFDRYPTCATLIADFDVGAWHAVAPGQARLVAFVVPRDIAGA